MSDNPNMTLRAALLEDVTFAAGQLSETMGLFGVHVLGLGSRERELAALSAFYIQPGNRFSHDAAFIAEHKGRPAGFLLAFPGREMNPRTLHLARPALCFFKLCGVLNLIWRAIPMGTDRECKANEYYIAHLAVHPDFKRQGIGHELLEAAAEQMHAAGLKLLSLIVDRENTPAVNLYRSAGFKVMEDHPSPRQIQQSGLHGYFRMVKSIPV